MKTVFVLALLASFAASANDPSINDYEHAKLVETAVNDLAQRGYTVYTSSDMMVEVDHPSELIILDQIHHYFTVHGVNDYGHGPEHETCTQSAIFTKGLNAAKQIELQVDFLDIPDCR